jgi:hypothetical protein
MSSKGIFSSAPDDGEFETSSGGGTGLTLDMTFTQGEASTLRDILDPQPNQTADVMHNERMGGMPWTFIYSDRNGDGIANWVELRQNGASGSIPDDEVTVTSVSGVRTLTTAVKSALAPPGGNPGDVLTRSDDGGTIWSIVDAEMPTIAIGTVTTGAAGSSAAASVTQSGDNVTLSFTIPAGAQGPTGANGGIVTDVGVSGIGAMATACSTSSVGAGGTVSGGSLGGVNFNSSDSGSLTFSSLSLVGTWRNISNKTVVGASTYLSNWGVFQRIA